MNIRTETNSLLLIFFTIGSLLGFCYKDYAELLLIKDAAILPAAFMIILLVNSLQLCSLTAGAVLPISSMIMGICTAALVCNVKQSFAMDCIPYTELMLLLAAVPIGFSISSIGMNQCRIMKTHMSSRKALYNKSILMSYSIMFLVTVLLAVSAKFIIKI